MDPDEARQQMLELARTVRTRMDSLGMTSSRTVSLLEEPLISEIIELTEHVEELDVWLRAGGFLPAAWTNKPDTQVGRHAAPSQENP